MDVLDLVSRLDALGDVVSARVADLEEHLEAIRDLRTRLEDVESIESDIEELESTIDD